jgi:hypothetical protein
VRGGANVDSIDAIENGARTAEETAWNGEHRGSHLSIIRVRGLKHSKRGADSR